MKDDAIYMKIKGRYRKIGYQWNGFPSNGIWLVQDGQNNTECLIGLTESVPIFALNYRIHKSKLAKRFVEFSRERESTSFDQLAKIACDYFAEVAKETKK